MRLRPLCICLKRTDQNPAIAATSSRWSRWPTFPRKSPERWRPPQYSASSFSWLMEKGHTSCSYLTSGHTSPSPSVSLGSRTSGSTPTRTRSDTSCCSSCASCSYYTSWSARWLRSEYSAAWKWKNRSGCERGETRPSGRMGFTLKERKATSYWKAGPSTWTGFTNPIRHILVKSIIRKMGLNTTNKSLAWNTWRKMAKNMKPTKTSRSGKARAIGGLATQATTGTKISTPTCVDRGKACIRIRQSQSDISSRKMVITTRKLRITVKRKRKDHSKHSWPILGYRKAGEVTHGIGSTLSLS